MSRSLLTGPRRADRGVSEWPTNPLGARTTLPPTPLGDRYGHFNRDAETAERMYSAAATVHSGRIAPTVLAERL
jgi:hypothetical protein